MIIVGAGLSGLIAAHAFPNAQVMEGRDAPEAAHKALLRFRTDKVAKLTGIPFKKVTVRKGIWANGQFAEPSITLANAYSEKVLGHVTGDRSIWNIDPVERFIAPPDFYERLAANVESRVCYGVPFDFAHHKSDHAIINTAPMNLVLQQLSVDPGVNFDYRRIKVERFKLKGVKDVFQTVYFPTMEAGSVYRASITDDVLIVESVNKGSIHWPAIVKTFWLPQDYEQIDVTSQRYGKIAEIDEGTRQAIVFQLTHKYNIFSVGRFATWRNILLDDVVDDLETVRGLINASHYERKLAI